MSEGPEVLLLALCILAAWATSFGLHQQQRVHERAVEEASLGVLDATPELRHPELPIAPPKQVFADWASQVELGVAAGSLNGRPFGVQVRGTGARDEWQTDILQTHLQLRLSEIVGQ